MSLRSHELAVETAFKSHENGSSEAVFNLVPGPGTHYFRYKGSWFQVSYNLKIISNFMTVKPHLHSIYEGLPIHVYEL